VVSLCWDEDALRGPGVDLRSVVAGEVGHG